MAKRHAATIGFAFLAWLGLLALTWMDGLASGGRVAVPFLQDLEVHVRILVALPLLIVAESAVVERIGTVPQQFRERGLIPDGARARFEAAVASALRLRDSALAEFLLIVFVYAVGILIWRRHVAADAATWYAIPSADGSRLSYAGMWYAWICLPLFQFLLCRWYFRLFIWARFLWQVSRVELKLAPAHPDGVGGLGFLTQAVRALTVFAAAHGALLAGYLGTRIVTLGTPLTQFGAEIAAMVVLVLIMTAGPPLVFVARLTDAKRIGLREYGALAMRYVTEFDAKWIRSEAGAAEGTLGSADFQSLADMGNAYSVVRTMRTVPIANDAIYSLALATLLPILPLLLTMMPLEELLRKIAGILF